MFHILPQFICLSSFICKSPTNLKEIVNTFNFEHLSVFRFKLSFIRLFYTYIRCLNFDKAQDMKDSPPLPPVDVTYDRVSTTSFCGYSTMKFFNSLCSPSFFFFCSSSLVINPAFFSKIIAKL